MLFRDSVLENSDTADGLLALLHTEASLVLHTGEGECVSSVSLGLPWKAFVCSTNTFNMQGLCNMKSQPILRVCRMGSFFLYKTHHQSLEMWVIECPFRARTVFSDKE